MQNKGSAVAFLFVLLVMCVGGCVAFSALTSGRGPQTVSLESSTPTWATEPTPAGSTSAPTYAPAETPSPHSELSTPVAPSATPVPPSTPTPQASATPAVPPTATRTTTGPGPAPPPGSYQYRVIRNERDCTKGGVIGGWVYDTAGNGLPWASVRIYNDFGWTATQQSEGPPQSGKYEFPLGDAVLFHLEVVDNDGRVVSPTVDVNYDPTCSQRVDWERVQ